MLRFKVSHELDVKETENNMMKTHDRSCLPLSEQIYLVPARYRSARA